MKHTAKVFILVILLGLFTYFLVACNEESTAQNAIKQDFEAYLASYSDSAGSAHEIEINIWKRDKYVDSTAKQTITKTINGKVFQGTYSHSERIVPNTYDWLIYKNENGDEIIVDETGTLQNHVWVDDIDTESKLTYTEEECLEIAKKFIHTDVSKDINLDEYTIKTEFDEDVYEFSFSKFINGCRTIEEAFVKVHKSGALYSFSSFMFGKISEKDFVEFDSEKVAEVIGKKINTIYQNVKGDNARMTYEPEIYFTLLDNGEPALYCNVVVKFTTPSGGGYGEMSERLGLIIK